VAPVNVYVDGGANIAPALDDPWPNPATDSLRFTLQVPTGSTGSLRIYDLRGRLVHAREVPSGTHFGEWDGRDEQGRRLPSGGYLLKLDGAGAPVTRKVVLRH
jgi:flagellar hook assembly protein FlgD